MKTITFQGYRCNVVEQSYDNGRLALLLMSPKIGPVARATVNLPEIEMADDEVAIKDYGENAGILAALVEAGIVCDTGRRVASGFVQIPICQVLP